MHLWTRIDSISYNQTKAKRHLRLKQNNRSENKRHFNVNVAKKETLLKVRPFIVHKSNGNVLMKQNVCFGLLLQYSCIFKKLNLQKLNVLTGYLTVVSLILWHFSVTPFLSFLSLFWVPTECFFLLQLAVCYSYLNICKSIFPDLHSIAHTVFALGNRAISK